MTTARAKADAATQEDMAGHWRDWCGYLHAQLTLFRLRVASANRTAFEREESGEEQEAAANLTISSLPAGRRTLFAAIHEQRRQQVQTERERTARMQGGSRRMLDPDAIDQEALTALLDEAEGRASADGWGQVPLGTIEQPEWYRVDVLALNDAPSAALYALGQTSAADRQRRIRLMAGLIGGCVVVLALWLLWPKSTARPVPVNTQIAAIVNGVAIRERWLPRTLILRSPAAVLATLPVSGTNSRMWPTSAPESSASTHALWWIGQSLPQVFCVPAEAMATASEVRILAAGGAPERRYALRDTLGETGDLRLEACDAPATKTRAIRIGVLQTTEVASDAALGQPVELNETTRLTLREVAVIGPGADPTLPTGQVRITVHVAVAGRNTLDWPALAPTLLLASGTALLPGSTEPVSDGMQLVYLAPTPLEAQAAVWSVLPPGQDRPLRWRVVVTPPASRDAIVREQLVVNQLTADVVDGLLQIHVIVANRGTTPLLLTPADLLLRRDELAIPLPSVPELAEPIPAGAERSFSLALPIEGGRRVLVLGIGAVQYRVTVPA